jgi:hypothetical protein
MDVVSAITDQMLTEECSRTLAADVQEVLLKGATQAASDDGVEDALGEPETEEERLLRDELGDRFAKCIELALKLADQKPTSPAAETVLRQLLDLLGKQAYLIGDVQRVAAFFEVDE